jgi:hypothetical protein
VAVGKVRSDESNRRVFSVRCAQVARFWRTGQHKLRRGVDQRRAQDVSDRHHPVGETDGHSGYAVAGASNRSCQIIPGWVKGAADRDWGTTAVGEMRSDGSKRRIFPVERAQFAQFWRTGQRKLRRGG